MKTKAPTVDFSFIIASSVHDMKNSVGMLLNTIGDVIAQYPPQSETHAKSYAVLEYEAARINSELIQLLSIYRLEHDDIRVHIDEYYVIDMLNDQIARNHGVFQSRKIHLQVDCDDKLQGYFDADLIGSVMNNILVNCARYCKNQLYISARNTDEGLCISIEDDGPGYPENMLDNPADTEIGFAGGKPHLGLFFAQRVALMHQSKDQQGFIRLHNGGKLGGGCFSLYLP
ncbi:MAG TPA: HAMP domain-containing sensor histidine kinase [Cellvibrio sp.]|nr:HAMP domain-containing sensor histidine kinase [Cellvibrio sp.]